MPWDVPGDLVPLVVACLAARDLAALCAAAPGLTDGRDVWELATGTTRARARRRAAPWCFCPVHGRLASPLVDDLFLGHGRNEAASVAEFRAAHRYRRRVAPEAYRATWLRAQHDLAFGCHRHGLRRAIVGHRGRRFWRALLLACVEGLGGGRFAPWYAYCLTGLRVHMDGDVVCVPELDARLTPRGPSMPLAPCPSLRAGGASRFL